MADPSAALDLVSQNGILGAPSPSTPLRAGSSAPLRTGSFDYTPAALMVFLLWVMTTNCVLMLISLMRSVKRPTLASSRMQNGLGANWKMAGGWPSL